MPGKRVQLDEESWAALKLLARDRMMTFQELADEAFADVLKKHGRPVDLRAALRKSAQAADAAEEGRAKTRNGKSPRR
jgi:predicted DNA-binding ribbon-helix-helix protein